MDEFNEKGISIQEETIEELRNQYTLMLKEHRTYLIKEITKILQEQMSDLPKLNIESLIDEQLLTEVKYNGIFTINKLHEELNESFNSVIIGLQDKNNDKEILFALYINELKEPMKRNQMDWFDDIITDFTNKLIDTIQGYCHSQKNISNPNIDQIIKNIMQKYKNKFFQDYNSIQKAFVTKNVTQISELIKKTDFTKLKSSEYEKFSQLIDLSNYELIEEAGIFYAQDKKTKEKFELSINGDILSSKDNKLRYIMDKKKKMQGFLNNETKRGIVVESERISLTSLDDKTSITISKSEGNYEFKRNLQPIKNIKEIKAILREIRDDYPSVFEKIIKDKDLAPIVRAIGEYNKKLAEIKQKVATQNQVVQSPNPDEQVTEYLKDKKK